MNHETSNQTTSAPAVASSAVLGVCPECDGTHERTGARIDCIRHWRLRALQAESVPSMYLRTELWKWLGEQVITSENIGNIRRQCFVPWNSAWNALVRDETAARENKTPNNRTEP